MGRSHGREHATSTMCVSKARIDLSGHSGHAAAPNARTDASPIESARQLSLPLSDHVSADPWVDVYRPMQYLGAKLRSLPQIIAIVDQMQPRPKTVLDIFSGSTVVSQAFARQGMRVIAADVMSYSTVFGRALLSVGRNESALTAQQLLDLVAPPPEPTRTQLALQPWITEEAEAISARDPNALIRISAAVAQTWRPDGASPSQMGLFDQLRRLYEQEAFPVGGLISAHYAGTYFGLNQAAEIDRIRVAIHEQRELGAIGTWERDALLTALLGVASSCVFSAGKHFAQPYRIREGKDPSFSMKRILHDRSIDVWASFVTTLASVFSHSASPPTRHRVLHSSMEDLLQENSILPDVDLVYADPPYTAQQYSRFYHIPETIVTYRVPRLQKHRGKITRGLYPQGRHKSRFCSKTQATAAFSDLFTLVGINDATLLLSYSDTRSGQTGNERMLLLSELLHLCHTFAGEHGVQVFELGHSYRQLNVENSAVPGREDKEYLILCRRT